jgi:AGCS family alanine or glycine:cation symporter
MMNFKKIMLLAVAATGMATTANAQEAMTIDQKVNDIFANVTGPFVNFIFCTTSRNGLSLDRACGWSSRRRSSRSISGSSSSASSPCHRAGEGRLFRSPMTRARSAISRRWRPRCRALWGSATSPAWPLPWASAGPGATFWMILAGLLGMASKFTECTLGVKYRNEYEDGTVSGGPMYYISKGFKELGLPGGKFLAIMFSIFCILGALGGGNMFQANQAHAQISGIVGDYPGLDHRY